MTSTALETVKALPEPALRRGINEAQWRTLFNLYPGAKPESILLVWDYCLARRLDPLKKPCHIVPLEVKNPRTGNYEWRDVVLPGIYELRTTAQRTGVYLGHSAPDYGPLEPYAGVGAPAWCAITFYRWNSDAGVRAEYPVRVLFREVVAVKKDQKANSRWAKAPVQMLTKCTEAAGLREAFPDEIGGEHTLEELEGQRSVDVQVVDDKPQPAPPDQYGDVLADLEAVADSGLDALEDAFAKLSDAHRTYLTSTDATTWETLKARAARTTGGNR
jgi:phage recombination protein Bet